MTKFFLILLFLSSVVATEREKERYEIKPVDPEDLALLVRLTDDPSVCEIVGAKVLQQGDSLSRSFRLKNAEKEMTVRTVFGPRPFLSISVRFKGVTATLVDIDIDGRMDYVLVTSGEVTRRIDRGDIVSWIKLQGQYVETVRFINQSILDRIDLVEIGPFMD